MQILKHFRTYDRVSFYNLKFFRRQPSGLVEYLVVYRDFSNIVQGGCCADKQYIVFCKVILVRLFDKILQKYRCKLFYVMNVHSALAVSEFYYMGKNVYHHTVVLFILVNLLLKGI